MIDFDLKRTPPYITNHRLEPKTEYLAAGYWQYILSASKSYDRSAELCFTGSAKLWFTPHIVHLTITWPFWPIYGQVLSIKCPPLTE